MEPKSRAKPGEHEKQYYSKREREKRELLFNIRKKNTQGKKEKRKREKDI